RGCQPARRALPGAPCAGPRAAAGGQGAAGLAGGGSCLEPIHDLLSVGQVSSKTRTGRGSFPRGDAASIRGRPSCRRRFRGRSMNKLALSLLCLLAPFAHADATLTEASIRALYDDVAAAATQRDIDATLAHMS